MNTATNASMDREIFARNQATKPRRGFDIDKLVESIRNVATVSELLRFLGAAVILASMSLFLLQGWSEGNDIRRYLMLLAQTGLLAGGGFAMSYGLKEAKGARIFFGLALISVTANFTILGALIYSVFQLDNALTTYPGYATWQITDIASIGATTAGALVVLIPIALFCFMVMARQSAKQLTLAFVPLNALLLIPARESVIAGALALAGTAFALWTVRKLTRNDSALQTGEGRFALLSLFVPLGIVLFRSMYFYDIDSLMVAMLSGAVFIALRQAAIFPSRHKVLASLLDVAALPVALVTAVALAASFEYLDIEILAPLTGLVYAAMAGDVLRRTGSRVVSGFTAFTASFAIAAGFVLAIAVEPSIWMALSTLAAGVMLGLAGSWLNSRSAMIAGMLTMLAAATLGFDEFVDLVTASNWITLAIIGAAAIALGSLLERHGVAIKLAVIERAKALAHRREEAVLDD